MNSTILNLVLNSINNESVEKELDDNRTINPFVVINKYITPFSLKNGTLFQLL
jgi:hypothetical protein